MATRADVARLAGVSEAAVSYSISGKKPISRETRERVFEAMRTLDYRPNAMARGLAGGKSMIIALLFPTRERGISNADLEYVLGAANAARALGYHLILWPTEDRDVEEVRTLHRTGLIDGVLLMEVRLSDERVALLREAGVPLGLIGRTRDDDDVVYADRDFDAATELSVAHLASLGHTRLVFLSGDERIVSNEFAATVRAEDAFLRAIASRGLSGSIIYCESDVTAGRAVARQIFDTLPEVSGIVAMNVEATVGVLAEAGDQGRDIPGSLSVVSIATPTSFVAASSPLLTTVSPPAADIGRVAARRLIGQLGNLRLPPEPALWAGELVVRDSTGPAPLAPDNALPRPTRRSERGTRRPQ